MMPGEPGPARLKERATTTPQIRINATVQSKPCARPCTCKAKRCNSAKVCVTKVVGHKIAWSKAALHKVGKVLTPLVKNIETQTPLGVRVLANVTPMLRRMDNYLSSQLPPAELAMRLIL